MKVGYSQSLCMMVTTAKGFNYVDGSYKICFQVMRKCPWVEHLRSLPNREGWTLLQVFLYLTTRSARVGALLQEYGTSTHLKLLFCEYIFVAVLDCAHCI